MIMEKYCKNHYFTDNKCSCAADGVSTDYPVNFHNVSCEEKIHKIWKHEIVIQLNLLNCTRDQEEEKEKGKFCFVLRHNIRHF